MLKIKVLICSDFQQNTRVLWDEVSSQALCIDPGSKDAGVVEFMQTAGLSLEAIILTHSHIDHFGGVQTVLNAFPKTPLYGHPNESEFRKRFAERLAVWGISPDNYDGCPEPDRLVSGGEKIKLLGRDFETIFTPGHSPGSLSWYCDEESLVLSGDVLFRGSIGRTDLPGGSLDELNRSLAKLLQLPLATKVLSGHGPDTTIGHEKAENLYVKQLL